MERPATLTREHAFECLPTMSINPEWQAKKDRGELPEGLKGLFGSMITTWPETTLTEEEARYILHLRKTHSWRALADEILGDSNQIFGMDLEEAAKRVSQ